jgi:hypothetical protein
VSELDLRRSRNREGRGRKNSTDDASMGQSLMKLFFDNSCHKEVKVKSSTAPTSIGIGAGGIVVKLFDRLC